MKVQAEVDRLAIGLHRSVVITDPAVRLLYMSRHFGDEDSVRVQTILNRETDVHAVVHVLAQGVAGWTKAGVIPANEGLGLRPRYCVPLRWRGRLLALLMITIDDEATTPPGLGSVEAAAKTITARLAVQAQGDDADQVEDALVHALVSPEPVTRRRALAELDDKGRHAEIASATVVVIGCSQLEDDGDGHYFEAVCRTAFARLHTEAGNGDHLHAITQSTMLIVVLVRKDHNDQPAVQFTHRFIRNISDLSDGRLICTAGVGSHSQISRTPTCPPSRHGLHFALPVRRPTLASSTGQTSGQWRPCCRSRRTC